MAPPGSNPGLGKDGSVVRAGAEAELEPVSLGSLWPRTRLARSTKAPIDAPTFMEGPLAGVFRMRGCWSMAQGRRTVTPPWSPHKQKVNEANIEESMFGLGTGVKNPTLPIIVHTELQPLLEK